jgi:hypothetical protein
MLSFWSIRIKDFKTLTNFDVGDINFIVKEHSQKRIKYEPKYHHLTKLHSIERFYGFTSSSFFQELNSTLHYMVCR